jgi:GTP-binding protein EngB required for normal cell division
METSKESINLDVIVLGDRNVGKSSFIKLITDGNE